MKKEVLKINTRGNCDIIDITSEVKALAGKNKIEEGILFLNVLGSTAGITTMEYEPGQVEDLKDLLDKLIPYSKNYAHNAAWQDDNGHSHLRSSLIKTNFFVSVSRGKLDLGHWQQIILVDFDTRPRQREIVVTITE